MLKISGQPYPRPVQNTLPSLLYGPRINDLPDTIKHTPQDSGTSPIKSPGLGFFKMADLDTRISFLLILTASSFPASI